ncbi:hypothetical protein DEN96_02995 [Escherichia coli]|uniref:Uncharacterized protein n=1 Tax=Escherichia coli TaxID=562 RepID=A0A2A2BNZ6_ECOLX|nr:hypothetical protein I3W_25990 [Escherichia coli O43 str. RM10042]OTC09424.1 hypothetical protein AW071_24485 [Escherichia coli]QCH44795.1 hypothetical protein C8202_04435 [Escherichia coli O113:H21]QCH60431.1 hypothetical protein CAX06_004390 [Escherichia coli O91:H21]OTE32322.1 hypothetical protein AW114_25290 [Escherichia coli]
MQCATFGDVATNVCWLPDMSVKNTRRITATAGNGTSRREVYYYILIFIMCVRRIQFGISLHSEMNN